MGAKAKAAIAGAERAIASMTKFVTEMKGHYDSMYAQQGKSIDAHMALASYVKDTYPKDENLTARAANDPKIKKFVDDIAAAKKLAGEFREACVADLENFSAEGDKIVAAVNKVTELINAKRAKRNEPTKNVLKKLVNKVKTKSLGDLVAEKAKVIAVIEQIGPIVDQVKNDIAFRKR